MPSPYDDSSQNKRKIIQISTHSFTSRDKEDWETTHREIYALCDDGTLWWKVWDDSHEVWFPWAQINTKTE